MFFLVDDLGRQDLGCYGSTFYETPNIDRLAAQGMRFTNAYAACPVCSPTRASIMTGKYPARIRLTNYIAGARPGKLLSAEYFHYMKLEEVTLAEALKEAGYKTCFVGKWHLGDEPYYPERQGFDVNIAGDQLRLAADVLLSLYTGQALDSGPGGGQAGRVPDGPTHG